MNRVVTLDALYPPFAERVRAVLAQANRETEGKFALFDAWVVFETFRSQDRQNELYAQGRTTKGSIVTNARTSRHTSGLAVDIVWRDLDGRFRWDGNDALWARLGHAARKQGLAWGGDWKSFVDKPHIEAKPVQYALWLLPARAYLKKKGYLK